MNFNQLLDYKIINNDINVFKDDKLIALIDLDGNISFKTNEYKIDIIKFKQELFKTNKQFFENILKHKPISNPLKEKIIDHQLIYLLNDKKMASISFNREDININSNLDLKNKQMIIDLFLFKEKENLTSPIFKKADFNHFQITEIINSIIELNNVNEFVKMIKKEYPPAFIKVLKDCCLYQLDNKNTEIIINQYQNFKNVSLCKLILKEFLNGKSFFEIKELVNEFQDLKDDNFKTIDEFSSLENWLNSFKDIKKTFNLNFQKIDDNNIEILLNNELVASGEINPKKIIIISQKIKDEFVNDYIDEEFNKYVKQLEMDKEL